MRALRSYIYGFQHLLTLSVGFESLAYISVILYINDILLASAFVQVYGWQGVMALLLRTPGKRISEIL